MYESICVEGKCSGIKKGKKCNYNYQCLAGLYCDINEGICKEQKNKNDICNNSYECKNYLLCFEGKCLDKLFELKEYEKPPENEKNREKYCKYGILDKNGEFCGKIIDIKNNNNNKDGNYNKCEIRIMDDNFTVVNSFQNIGDNVIGVDFFYKITKNIVNNNISTGLLAIAIIIDIIIIIIFIKIFISISKYL